MKRILIICLAIFLFGCKKEEGTDVQILDPAKTKVVVLNQGNFRSSNSSVDIYYPEDHQLQEGVFSSNNEMRPLGDIAQSAIRMNNELWIVVNNSSKIEIVNPQTFKSIGKLDGLNSPRYILPIDQNKAYVSDLYEDKIYVIDLANRSVSKTLNTGGWTEEMLLIGQNALVCMPDDNRVAVWDAVADTLIKNILTNRSPQALEKDANGMIWVSFSGGYNEASPGLHRIDPTTLDIDRSMIFSDISKSISNIALSQDGQSLYYQMGDIFKISIEDTVLASSAMIQANGKNFYAMNTDPSNGDLYLSDAIDFQQRGIVYRYSPNGQLIHQFKSGLIPGFFYFMQ